MDIIPETIEGYEYSHATGEVAFLFDGGRRFVIRVGGAEACANIVKMSQQTIEERWHDIAMPILNSRKPVEL